jgi:hypothetical protein
MDEFYEKYNHSTHLYRLIEFIVLSFLNTKFAEKPVENRAPMNINSYTLKIICNADFEFDWAMTDYFNYKLRKCKQYIKQSLNHKISGLTIEQNKSLFLNLQSLTPRNTRVVASLNEIDPFHDVDVYRLFAFNVKYNSLDEFLFHMATNMFSREYTNGSLICTEETSGSVLANGNIGCFVVALWASGLIDTDTYLYILQGFENIFSSGTGTSNDAVIYSMNIFLTQTLIRLYKNRNTTIKIYSIPYMFDRSPSILTTTLLMIVNEIETRVKELLEQLEISSRNLFHTNMDDSIGDIKVPLITIIRYTPTSHGFAHTFNLIIEGNSLNMRISIADFYENKAITNSCDDGTLKYKNILLQRKYNADVSSDFSYTNDGKTYDNILPIAPLSPVSIMGILRIQQHERDDGYFQLFCEVTTDVKDGEPFFNIDPRFLLNNDKSVTRAKQFISRIKKTRRTKKNLARKFVNTIKKRLGKPLLVSTPRSSSSSIDSPISNREMSSKLAQKFALAVFSHSAKLSYFERIIDNPNFNCNQPIDAIEPSLIPTALKSSKSFNNKIQRCVDQKNTPLLVIVGSKFTDIHINVIIKLLDMNCNINYINSNGDNALTILLEKTNSILEEIEDIEDQEDIKLLKKDYETHIFLALRLIDDGADVNYGNGTTPLEYALKFKSKSLITELLDKGVIASSIRQQEMIDRILYQPSSSSLSSSSSPSPPSASTPSDVSSFSFSSLDLLDRGTNPDTPPPPLERISSDSKSRLVDIGLFKVSPPSPLTPQSLTPRRRKLPRKKSKKSTGSLPSLNLDEIVL